MTQYESSQFAEIYDRRWSGFAVRTAPIWYALLRYGERYSKPFLDKEWIIPEIA